MYLRAILCTFQISVDFYYVLYLWVGEEGGRWGAVEGEGARMYCMGTVPIQLVTHTVSVLTVPAIF